MKAYLVAKLGAEKDYLHKWRDIVEEEKRIEKAQAAFQKKIKKLVLSKQRQALRDRFTLWKTMAKSVKN